MRLSSPIIIAYMQSMSPCFITSPGPHFITSLGPGPVRILQRTIENSRLVSLYEYLFEVASRCET